MRNELNRMVANVTDPAKKKVSYNEPIILHLYPSFKEESDWMGAKFALDLGSS